jgi:hypothetical protein
MGRFKRHRPHARWGEGKLQCVRSDGQLVGKVRRTNVEVEVQLMRGCSPDVLGEEPPPVGTSSLPQEALQRSLWLRKGKAPSGRKAKRRAKESDDLLRVRAGLNATNSSLSILALGASVTFMFADMCSESDSHVCSTGPYESLITYDQRIGKLRQRRSKPKYAEDADWLVQLLRTLKKGHPHLQLSARSVAYGGMNPKTVAACIADFVAAPPSARLAQSQGTTAPPQAANLVILDFAIFGGIHPIPQDVNNIETLIRALWPLRVAVLMINMPTWCIGPSGRLEANVHEHQDCQRMIFDRAQSQLNVAATMLPGDYDSRLTELANHYGQTPISVFSALQPLIAHGQLDLLDFTHDGKHPILFPRRTRRGAVLSRFMADLLAHAIDPNLHHFRGDKVWRGGEPPGRKASIAARRFGRNRTRNHALHILTTSTQTEVPPARGLTAPVPPALDPTLVSATRGVRCYGWGARATRGAWKSIILRDQGWNLTKEELAYDESSRAWHPLAVKRVKPGLTSVSPGDVVSLQIDTTLGRHANVSGIQLIGEHAMLQLTYLQSYEQVGVLLLECTSGCYCDPHRIQTLEPSRLATLNTTLWPVSESRKCTLRLTNASPRYCASGRGPCTKIKLVALAVAAAPDSFDVAAAAEAAARYVQRGAVGLEFL